MNLWTLFVTASIPVVESFLITALGSYLALDRVNLFGPDSRHHLNTIVFYVFTPALVGSKLAETITYDSMVKLWFMPVNVLLTFIFGSLYGWILVKITTTPPHLRGLVLGCCAAGNLGNLLLIIIPAVCEESGSPFGDADSCDTTGTAYAALSMAVLSLEPFLFGPMCTILSGYIRRGALKIPRKPQRARQLPAPSLCFLEDNVDQCQFPSIVSEGDAKMTCLGKIKQWMVNMNEKLNLKTALSPSTVAVFIGLAVGTISPIRNFFVGDDAPLVVIDDSTSLLGDAAIPLLTLIIGGNLVKGLKAGGIQKSVLIGIIIVKYVAAPLTGILIVKGAVKLGFVSNDPLYLFVLMLQFALPPAMNMGTITQLFGQGESECSVIMLWTYVFASLSLTFWCALFLWLVA